MPPNLRLSDKLIDLMQDFSFSEWPGYRWCLGGHSCAHRPPSTSVTGDGEINLSEAHKQGFTSPRRRGDPGKPAGYNCSPVSVLRKFIIERDIPKVGTFEREQLRGAAPKSNGVLRRLGPDIQWLESYVADDKTFCV
jgi:Protein of unknown function (DUF4242)